MSLTPLIAFHMGWAIAATAVGPVALWARRDGQARPALHRAAGYGFVLLMLGAAFSALLIRDFSHPNWGGFTVIHLLAPITLFLLARSFWHLRHHAQAVLWSLRYGGPVHTVARSPAGRLAVATVHLTMQGDCHAL